MDELKSTIASNIIELRTNAGMKQAELAEKINYSDKSVSKWERAEAVPDVAVLKSIADVFGVSVDFLINPHDEWSEREKRISAKKRKKEKRIIDHKMIISVAIMGIWAVALLIFIIFWLLGHMLWYVFLSAVPVSLITLLVLHSIWGKGKYNLIIISLLMISILLLIYFLFLNKNWWQIFLLAIPLEIIIILCFRIIKPKKEQDEQK